MNGAGMIDADVIRLRQIDGFLRALIKHEDPARTAMFERCLLAMPDVGADDDPTGTLEVTAKEFQVFGDRHADRRRQLAKDLSAIIRLYEFLQRENSALAKATLSKTTKQVETWVFAVAKLHEAIKAFQSVGKIGKNEKEELGGSLASLTALEIIMEAVLAEASGGNQILRRKIGQEVDAALSEARYQMLCGEQDISLPLATLDEKLISMVVDRPKSADDEEIPNDEHYFAFHQARKRDEAVATAQKKAAFLYRDVEAGLAMFRASEGLKAVFSQLEMKDLTRPVVPSAAVGLVWSVALLIDGWKPRSDHGHGRPMTVAANKHGHVATLTRDLVNGLKMPEEDRQFGKTAESAGEVMKKRRSAPHVFTGRRLTGLKDGQFFPDRFDRLTSEQAALLERLQIPVPEGVVIPRQIVHRLQWPQP